MITLILRLLLLLMELHKEYEKQKEIYKNQKTNN